jgi:hypothetical protein
MRGRPIYGSLPPGLARCVSVPICPEAGPSVPRLTSIRGGPVACHPQPLLFAETPEEARFGIDRPASGFQPDEYV